MARRERPQEDPIPGFLSVADVARLEESIAIATGAPAQDGDVDIVAHWLAAGRLRQKLIDLVMDGQLEVFVKDGVPVFRVGPALAMPAY